MKEGLGNEFADRLLPLLVWFGFEDMPGTTYIVSRDE